MPHLSESAFPALSSHHPVIASYDLPFALCTFHLNPQYLYSAGQREYIFGKLESKKIPPSSIKRHKQLSYNVHVYSQRHVGHFAYLGIV